MEHNKTAIVQLTVALMCQTAQRKLDAGRCAGSKTGIFQLHDVGQLLSEMLGRNQMVSSTEGSTRR